jgi:hypothetical protein
VVPLNVIGQSAAQSIANFETGKLINRTLIRIHSFSLAVETASKLTFIKHNLLLEHANLFKPKKHVGPDEIEDDYSPDDDEIIEDC